MTHERVCVLSRHRRSRWSAWDSGRFGKVCVADSRDGTASDPAGCVGGRRWRRRCDNGFTLHKCCMAFFRSVRLGRVFAAFTQGF